MKKIFGIGLSRTGTTSLTHALDGAGIHINHYPNEIELFDPRSQGASDIPVAIHYKKLDVTFPDPICTFPVTFKFPLILVLPTTSSFAFGDVVPIPIS